MTADTASPEGLGWNEGEAVQIALAIHAANARDASEFLFSEVVSSYPKQRSRVYPRSVRAAAMAIKRDVIV